MAFMFLSFCMAAEMDYRREGQQVGDREGEHHQACDGGYGVGSGEVRPKGEEVRTVRQLE